MNTDKIHLLRDFVSSLETTDADAQDAILEALNALGDSESLDYDGNTPGSPNYEPDVLDIGWETLLEGLNTLVADKNAGDMTVQLRNNSGGHYLFFKTNDKIEFVTNVSNAPDVEEALKTVEPEKSKFLGKAAY